ETWILVEEFLKGHHATCADRHDEGCRNVGHMPLSGLAAIDGNSTDSECPRLFRVLESLGARAVEAAELRSLDVSGEGEADANRERHQVRGHVDPQLMGNLAGVLDNAWLAWHNHVHRKTRFAGEQRHRIQRGQAGMS